jgi:hypothetical protein|tara:strand:+ start:813 stop:1115 length:303 start_codon:yes stop_codon:yes gene_type:complete
MRVKLSYTIEEDKVFEETGQLLGLRAGTLQGVIDLFTAVQTELQQKDEPVNVARVQQQIGELREGLVLVDLRLSEISEIIQGYVTHHDTAASAEEEEKNE